MLAYLLTILDYHSVDSSAAEAALRGVFGAFLIGLFSLIYRGIKALFKKDDDENNRNQY